MKSGNLNFLEPSGPLQACNRTALPYYSLMKLGFSWQILKKYSNKICPVGVALFHEDWTDMTKLIVAFSSFANALKHLWKSSAGWFFSKLWICPQYSYFSMKYLQWWWQSHVSGYSVKTWNSTSHSGGGEVSSFFNWSKACTQVRKHKHSDFRGE